MAKTGIQANKGDPCFFCKPPVQRGQRDEHTTEDGGVTYAIICAPCLKKLLKSLVLPT